MSPRLALLTAAVLGALAVVLGAFGAHALRARLSPELLAIWRTGVEYHFWHVLALFGVGLLGLGRAGAGSGPWLGWAALCFALGILVFSGSLYALSLSGLRGLGAVTPFGGLLLIAGWVLLAVHLTRLPD